MIVVHHLENSRSQRVLWLLEELGVPYELKLYQRNPKTMLAPPELRAVHPLGKSPVLSVDGKTVAESGAIIEYLVERYGTGRFIPGPGSDNRLRYTYWMHYAEGSLMPPLLLALVMAQIRKAPWPVRPIAKAIANKVSTSFVQPQLDLHLDYIESELTKHTWFAGSEFTAADVQMSYPMEAAAMRGGLDARRPKSMAFLARIHARPAYERAIAKGGPLGPMRSKN